MMGMVLLGAYILIGAYTTVKYSALGYRQFGGLDFTVGVGAILAGVMWPLVAAGYGVAYIGKLETEARRG